MRGRSTHTFSGYLRVVCAGKSKCTWNHRRLEKDKVKCGYDMARYPMEGYCTTLYILSATLFLMAKMEGVC